MSKQKLAANEQYHLYNRGVCGLVGEEGWFDEWAEIRFFEKIGFLVREREKR